MKFEADSIDDLLSHAYSYILDYGEGNSATKGDTIEVLGCELVLKNPIARVSRSESRGLIFSCLGELFWYLSGSNDIEPIKYYLPQYEQYCESNGKVHGGYGQRLFNMHEKYDQVERVIRQLKQKPTTRKAIIQLFDSSDLSEEYKDIPCTLNLQFTIRNNKLHMYTMMRSNDAFVGLPHDVFVFTMLQELIASELECELGLYHHYVVSLHLYTKNLDKVKSFLSEGFMWHNSIMQPMPKNSFTCCLEEVLNSEEKIRNGEKIDLDNSTLTDYWKDIVRLLLFFKLTKHPSRSSLKKAVTIMKSISNNNYKTLIEKRNRTIQESINEEKQA
ncbi:thymidylate synthase [Vibrio fluvialis]|uniref:thymidylate synthase n=1 Tax=Vibrio fluvialis TaxID=676 RepID=UPI001EE9FBD8|nr:thymidylate synthase [Vibrio fluvialis]